MILKYLWRDFIFPFSGLWKSTKQINNKTDKLLKSSEENPYSFEYASDSIDLDDSVLLEILSETIENKKKLEDKSKSSLIAITISASLILNTISFIEKNNSVGLVIVLAIFSFISLLYMIIAGILSLYSIAEINTVSSMFPEDYLKPDTERKTQIAENIEYNYLLNLKRNNFMTTSYKCIITSITCLVLVFIFSTILVLQGSNDVAEIKSDIKTVQEDLLNISIDHNTNKQNIIQVQQINTDIIIQQSHMTAKLNNLRYAIERINKQLLEEPTLINDEIVQILLELEKELNVD